MAATASAGGYPTAQQPRAMRVIRIVLHRDLVNMAGLLRNYVNVVLTPEMTCREATTVAKRLITMDLPPAIMNGPSAPSEELGSSKSSSSLAGGGGASSSLSSDESALQVTHFLAAAKLWSVCLGEAVPYDLIPDDRLLWDASGAVPRPKYELRRSVSKPPRSLSAESTHGSVIRIQPRDSDGIVPAPRRRNYARTLSVNLGYRKTVKPSTPSASFQPLPATADPAPDDTAFPGIRMLSQTDAPQSSSATADRLGFLYYRSQKGLAASWKKHFFRLSDGCLYQYRKEWSPAAAAQQPPHRVISLEDMLVTPLTKQESGKSFAFCLRPVPAAAARGVKTLVLSVPTQYDLTQWMKYVGQHVEIAIAKSGPPAAASTDETPQRFSSFGGVPLPRESTSSSSLTSSHPSL